MSLFPSLPIEVLHSLLQFCGEEACIALSRTAQQTAVAIAEALVTFHTKLRPIPFRMQYSVYLRARYAVGMHVYRVLRQFYFIKNLSRACRCCGRTTQRQVCGAPLCCACTREPRNRCWMVGIQVADSLGVSDHIFQHKGARVALVFAEHVQKLAYISRRDLVMNLGLLW